MDVCRDTTPPDGAGEVVGATVAPLAVAAGTLSLAPTVLTTVCVKMRVCVETDTIVLKTVTVTPPGPA